MKPRIVLTGSEGFVGKVIRRKLSLRQSDCYDILTGQDLTHSDQILSASLSDTILHLAAISGIKACEDDHIKAGITNTDITLQLAKEAKKAGCKRFIFASTSAVYGEAQNYRMDESHPTEPRSYYGQTKLDAERILDLADKSFEVVILRKSNLYGYGIVSKSITVLEKFISNFICHIPIEITGTGSQRRDFLHIMDASRVYYQLAQAKKLRSGIYNLGGGQNPSIRELAEMVNDIGESIFGYRVDIVYKQSQSEALWHDFTYCFKKAENAFQFKPIFTLDDVIKERLMIGFREQK